MKIYPLAKPYITGKEKEYVLRVLNSSQLSLGPKYREFEAKFAAKIGRRYACAVSSGTAGLHLALISANLKEGDEVITPLFPLSLRLTPFYTWERSRFLSMLTH